MRKCKIKSVFFTITVNKKMNWILAANIYSDFLHSTDLIGAFYVLLPVGDSGEIYCFTSSSCFLSFLQNVPKPVDATCVSLRALTKRSGFLKYIFSNQSKEVLTGGKREESRMSKPQGFWNWAVLSVTLLNTRSKRWSSDGWVVWVFVKVWKYKDVVCVLVHWKWLFNEEIYEWVCLLYGFVSFTPCLNRH